MPKFCPPRPLKQGNAGHTSHPLYPIWYAMKFRCANKRSDDFKNYGRRGICVSDAYRYFARHPKAERNPNWRAKVRQKLQQVGNRIERNAYVAAA